MPPPHPVTVTYWPSTKPSIKRCICVNKRKNSKTGASGRRYRNTTLTYSVIVADMYAQRKQVVVRQLYNQVPQIAWVSQFQFQLQLESVGDKMPAWESACRLRDCGPQWPTVEQPQPRWGRSAAMVRRTLGSYVAVCLRLQLTSHTQPTSTLSRIKCEGYIFL